MSPIAHVDNVRAPVLLLIGEDDLRAVPAQGLRFYDALKGREKRVEMLWFKGRHIRLMVLRRQGFRGRLGGIGLRI
jgi:dipeptidyl aminopeptidase/acylaminoacyl peptidase